MKKSVLIIVLSLLTALVSNAQEIIKAKHGSLWQEGTVLTDDEVQTLLGAETYAKYFAAQHNIKSAKTFMIVGLSGVGAGVLGMSSYILINVISPEEDSHLHQGFGGKATSAFVVGFYAAIIGGAVLVPSIPLYITGATRLKKIAKNYNAGQAPQYSLNLGMQQHGFGLALNF